MDEEEDARPKQAVGGFTSFDPAAFERERAPQGASLVRTHAAELFSDSSSDESGPATERAHARGDETARRGRKGEDTRDSGGTKHHKHRRRRSRSRSPRDRKKLRRSPARAAPAPGGGAARVGTGGYMDVASALLGERMGTAGHLIGATGPDGNAREDRNKDREALFHGRPLNSETPAFSALRVPALGSPEAVPGQRAAFGPALTFGPLGGHRPLVWGGEGDSEVMPEGARQRKGTGRYFCFRCVRAWHGAAGAAEPRLMLWDHPTRRANVLWGIVGTSAAAGDDVAAMVSPGGLSVSSSDSTRYKYGPLSLSMVSRGGVSGAGGACDASDKLELVVEGRGWRGRRLAEQRRRARAEEARLAKLKQEGWTIVVDATSSKPADVPAGAGPADDEERDETTWADAVLARTRTLNQHLAQHPGDESAWLQLASLQERAARVLQPHARGVARLTSAERRASVLRKALVALPRSERLAIELISALEVIEPFADVRERWRGALGDFPGSSDMHAKYLAWLRTRAGISGFALEDHRAEMMDLLARAAVARDRVCGPEVLRAAVAAWGELAAPPREVLAIEAVMAALVAGIVALDVEAGHDERARATASAVVDYCALPPMMPPHATEADKRAQFRRFFQSGAPRAGDADRSGWGVWETALTSEQEYPPPPPFPPPPPAAPAAEQGWMDVSDVVERVAKEVERIRGVSGVQQEPDIAQGGSEGEGEDGEQGAGDDGDGLYDMLDAAADEQLRAQLEDEAEREAERLNRDDLLRWLELEAERGAGAAGRADDLADVRYEDVAGVLHTFVSREHARRAASLAMAVLGAPTCDATEGVPSVVARAASGGAPAEPHAWASCGARRAWLARAVRMLAISEPSNPILQHALLLSNLPAADAPVCGVLRARDAVQRGDAFVGAAAPLWAWSLAEKTCPFGAKRNGGVAQALLAEETLAGAAGIWWGWAAAQARSGRADREKRARALDVALSVVERAAAAAGEGPGAGVARWDAAIVCMQAAMLELIETPASERHSRHQVFDILSRLARFPGVGRAPADAEARATAAGLRASLGAAIETLRSQPAHAKHAVGAASWIALAALHDALTGDHGRAAATIQHAATATAQSAPAATLALCPRGCLPATPPASPATGAELLLSLWTGAAACVSGSPAPHARIAVLRAAQAFPDNSRIVSLLHACDVPLAAIGAAVDAAAEDAPDGHASARDGLLGRALAVAAARERRGAPREVRALERAVRGVDGGGDPALWAALVWAQVRRGDGEGAKRALMRGVSRCPWSKALWMEGVRAVVGSGREGARDAGRLIALMRRVGVKVRTDELEVVLERMEREEQLEGEEGGE
ncbi:unnamed protein product [Pedinophyceae sp. YPF-701]|nr:unnamed protein product [Pedinophyceae sp. YPF-701]